MKINEYKIPEKSEKQRIRDNVCKRKKLKKVWDRHCKYDADTEYSFRGFENAIDTIDNDADNYIRLLDEGVVVDGDGFAYAVIAKGTLKNWYDNLPKNFKGYINKDHVQGFDLGDFTKENLRLVELEKGRYGIDVNVKLDRDLYATKDLLRRKNRCAVSAEFYSDEDFFVKAKDATGDEKQGNWLIPVINAVSLVGYAVVSNPKNANSYDEDLLDKASASEGEEMHTKDQMCAAGDESEFDPTLQNDSAAEEKIEETQEADEESKAEETEIEADVDKTEASAEEEGNETEDEKAEEPEAEEGDSDDNDGNEETEDLAAAIEEKIKAFKAEIAEKDAKISELEAKLSNATTEKETFESRLSTILGQATVAEPTAAEGAATTPEQKKSGFEAELEEAFKNL